MGRYIDADRLKAEIKRFSATEYNDGTFEDDVVNGALDHVLEEIIPSLQQGQPEGDLAEEIARFFSENPIPYEHIFGWPILKNTAIHFAEWGATHLNTKKKK